MKLVLLIDTFQIQARDTRMLRYLRGISKMSLCFESCKPKFIDYIDVDISGDIDFKKSTFVYLITFSKGAILLQPKLKSVSLCYLQKQSLLHLLKCVKKCSR